MCTLLWVLWRLSRQRYLAWRQAKNHQDEPRQTGFVVLFGMSQNLGGLIGSAILGTFQTWREKYHSSLLADKLSQLDPNVTERLDQYSALFRSQLTDSV
ncbi:hypothetical protein CRX72_14415 [Pantoea sp. BRM17]|nr:hypothetical protein CRX72_14415 [Pantoea sp. BRM17]